MTTEVLKNGMLKSRIFTNLKIWPSGMIQLKKCKSFPKKKQDFGRESLPARAKAIVQDAEANHENLVSPKNLG